ncbi:MAG: Crp/Fnr family transcriptional regulator [Rhizobiales bacterium]|nr:Crp/Fnr family transcriptional regulator [Hyphomicrobiales bacterium]NRB14908.1 Crp/Fnr family transcriptional regulator [Hyphomicrobiales bacterium]
MLPKLFHDLPANALKNINFQKSETIFRQYDETCGLYFVISGKVSLKRHSPNGDEIIIHNAGKNETFAEAALFSKEYHCDATAIETTQLVLINKAAVLAQMASNPIFAMNLSAQFARQIQIYRRRLEIQAIQSADERVYAAIGDGMLQGNIIKELAAHIGLSHEATYRSLANLVKRNKLTKFARGKYIIK